MQLTSTFGHCKMLLTISIFSFVTAKYKADKLINVLKLYLKYNNSKYNEI